MPTPELTDKERTALFARAQEIVNEEENQRVAEDGTLHESIMRLAFRIAQLESQQNADF